MYPKEQSYTARPQRPTAPTQYHPPENLPTGIADIRRLPDPEFLAQWDAIIVSDEIRDRLLGQAVLNFTLRQKVSRATVPIHGIILLVGPPGTGKTSLARGLAARTAEAFTGTSFTYMEVDPHALTSSALGKSQRAVSDLFVTVGERAHNGPTIVLLDEVETLVADRTAMSLDANPIDVHRATDAALVQLDRLAASHPNLLFIATSNFPGAIDAALISRADLVISVPRPDLRARQAILVDTLRALAVGFPAVTHVASDPGLAKIAGLTDGLDGRQLRKLVIAACALDKQVALNPSTLTLRHLELTAGYAVADLKSLTAAPQPASSTSGQPARRS